MNILCALQEIKYNGFIQKFKELYGSDETVLEYQKQRYVDAVTRFGKYFPQREDVRIFSASGRTEIGGNHTDHQHGCVLAAAVNLDTIAVAAFLDEKIIRVRSEGYEPFSVKLDNLAVTSEDVGTAAIIRGIAAKFNEIGITIGGFDLYCTSDVLSGSGISSPFSSSARR